MARSGHCAYNSSIYLPRCGFSWLSSWNSSPSIGNWFITASTIFGMSACVNGALSNTSPTSYSLVDETSCDCPCERRRLARGEWAVVSLLLVGWELARATPSLGGWFFHPLVLVVEVLVADSFLSDVFEVLVRLVAVFLPRVTFVLGILLRRQNCTAVFNQSHYSSHFKHVLPITHA